MTNDFLPIGTAGGANVETQAAYLADPDVGPFFPNGTIPNANQHGKMFRQCSVIISQLAQAVCDVLGISMLDDGNLAVTLANIKSLFQQKDTLNYCLDTGAANAYVATPSPALTAYPIGVRFRVKIGAGNTNADGASTLNLNGLGAKSVVGVFGINPPKGTLKAGQSYDFVYDGTNIVMPSLMSQGYSFGGASQFTFTGYKIDELGFIEQWGSVGGGGTGNTPASFPLAYSTIGAGFGQFFILGCAAESPPGGPGSAVIFGNAYPTSSTTFEVNSANNAYAVSWYSKGR